MKIRERGINHAMRDNMIARYFAEGLNDTYGARAIARAVFGGKEALTEEVIDRLNRAARWFELPHPTIPGRFLDGEQDFVAQLLVRLMYECDTILPKETLEYVHKFFTEYEIESRYKSENHMLLFHASRYLYALRYQDAYFKQYQMTAKEAVEADRKFLQDYIYFRAKRGWAEFDSFGYTPEVLDVLLNLYDYAEENMSRYAEMSANVILLDMIMDCSKEEGFYGGAHGRVYDGSVNDLKQAGMYKVYQYYFGEETLQDSYFEPLVSKFVPADYVYAVLNSRPDIWVNRECKHLHSITCPIPHKQVPQVPGSINKQTYVTPDYIMGGVTWQDKYPEGSEAAWYAHHEQHEWELSILPDSELRIFTHHPGLPDSGPTGREHGYWTGDLGCCCGQYFSEKNIAMATHDIPEGEADFIHARVPFAHLEVAERDGSYLWMKAQRVYVMLWMSEGISDGCEEFKDVEVRSYGRKHGVVCMVGLQKDYADMDAFKQAAKAGNPAFDKETMTLSYANLKMTPSARFIDGAEQVFPYETYDNPCVYSKHGSGVIETDMVVLDFNGWGSITYKK